MTYEQRERKAEAALRGTTWRVAEIAKYSDLTVEQVKELARVKRVPLDGRM